MKASEARTIAGRYNWSSLDDIRTKIRKTADVGGFFIVFHGKLANSAIAWLTRDQYYVEYDVIKNQTQISWN